MENLFRIKSANEQAKMMKLPEWIKFRKVEVSWGFFELVFVFISFCFIKSSDSPEVMLLIFKKKNLVIMLTGIIKSYIS